ncbi:MAG: SDR family oxidoreductase [Pseudomonadota bacterium]
MLLDGKSIIITGASSGIGRAAALLFAREGARLVLGARRRALLEEVASEIRAGGGVAAILAGDVGDETYAADLVELAHAEYGGLDSAFNNAGTLGETGPVADMSVETWRAVLNVNLTSAFFAAKHQAPALARRGGGSIVFTGTFVGHTVGLPGMGAYAASKAGLIGLAQTLAVEYGTKNVRVNTLLPGGTRTAMAPNDPTALDAIADFHALKRIAEPEEIAAAALYLLSDLSSFMTGSAMTVDGGNSIAKV